MPVPREVTPIVWVLAVVAAIAQISNFLGYPSLKPWLMLAAGVGLAIVFLLFAYRRSRAGRRRSPRLRRMALLGAGVSTLVLVVPPLLVFYVAIVYVPLIEPGRIDKALQSYLISRQLQQTPHETTNGKLLEEIASANDALLGRQLDVAEARLRDAVAPAHKPLAILEGLAHFVRGRIASERGQHQQAVDWFDQALTLISADMRPGARTLRAYVLNSKAVAYSRFHGADSAAQILIYDEAIAEAHRLQNARMEVLFETAKVTALQRIAAASKRRDDWAAWRLSSERSIDRWAGLSDSSMEYVGLQNHINGVREHYSQVLSRLELPDDAVTNDHAALQLETESLLREHDRLVARGKVIAAQASVDPESRRHAVINGLLFDHFSREPAPPFDAGVARQALAQVKPEAGHESQQYRAQWLQVSGLVELRDEQSALGIAKLAEALNIWHNQRNIAKERELVGDLLHALKDDPDRREASMELLFRWAGLRLLQSPFDLSAAHRPLLSDVVQRLHREHLLAADMLPASLRPK